MSLADKKCIPCRGGTPPMELDQLPRRYWSGPFFSTAHGSVRRVGTSSAEETFENSPSITLPDTEW